MEAYTNTFLRRDFVRMVKRVWPTGNAANLASTCKPYGKALLFTGWDSECALLEHLQADWLKHRGYEAA